MEKLCGCRYSRGGIRLLRPCKAHRAQTHSSTLALGHMRTPAQAPPSNDPVSHCTKYKIQDRLSPSGAETEIWTSPPSAEDLARPFRWDAPRHADLRDGTVPSRGFQPAYRAALGPTPVCRPGDTKAARAFLRRIDEVQDRFRGRLTRSEQVVLHRMEQRWARRAYGRDPRFMVMGNRGGALLPEQRERLGMWTRMVQHMGVVR